VSEPSRRIHAAAEVGFGSAADRYDRGRPSYPVDAVAYLVSELGIGSGRTVVDLAAGTGKFTEMIVPTGAHIIAVEPVAEMRAVLESACPTVEAIDGTAEALPLDDASVDAVVVAQAFHWFDGDRAVPEIRRVLRDGGRLGLIWNARDETPAWSRRLTEIFDELAEPTDPRYKHGAWRSAFERTDAFTPFEHRAFDHAHEVDRVAFIDRVLSVSYVASARTDVRDAVVHQVERLLDTDPALAGHQRISMPYRTDTYVCSAR
jgi:ubiquinone/menaquinone biosynthesis C-methylase UbiE